MKLFRKSEETGKGRRKKKSREKEVLEVYIDGRRREAELVDENVKSYGMFMHTLVLSSAYSESGSTGENVALTDVNEKAIIRFAYSKGFDKKLIDTIAPKMGEIEISPETDLHPSVHQINEKLRVVAKGSPIELIQRCSYVLKDTQFIKLTRGVLHEIYDTFWAMVDQGLKVYALAIRDFSDGVQTDDRGKMATDMAFVALVAVG